jgi:hypothetical protein
MPQKIPPAVKVILDKVIKALRREARSAVSIQADVTPIKTKGRRQARTGYGEAAKLAFNIVLEMPGDL